GTLTLALSQQATAGGGSSLVPAVVSCYTSTDGSLVGLPNPQVGATGGAFTTAGILAAGRYYVSLAYTGASGADTLASPSAEFALNAPGEIEINAPVLQPTGATGYAVYIGIAPGAETLQGTVTGWAGYTQATLLTSGAAAPGTNTSPCSLYFNDQIIPTSTWYTATLSDNNGNVEPGFPRNWYLSGGSVNVGTLLPLASNPAVQFPNPLLATPADPAVGQSLTGALTMNFYPLHESGNVGPGLFNAYWSGAAGAAGTTLAGWTPNSAISIQRIDVNAQTAGAGGINGITLAISDGTHTCTFTNLLPAAATNTSEAASGSAGNCVFHAGVPLTVQFAGDDHTSGPQNLNVGIELTVY
ncbi:MAG: hypothetical protein ACRD1Y_11240, partial [Terriglobales bacterium]